jgi:hypothetical protein
VYSDKGGLSDLEQVGEAHLWMVDVLDRDQWNSDDGAL